MASPPATMFTLGHLSDLHLAPPRRPRLAELAGKRALGHANWQLSRRLEHRAHVLDAVVEKLLAAAPDHVAVTGDLVNTAAAGEFAPARGLLERLGRAEAVTFVPGNHDAYVRGGLGLAARHWGDFMRDDAPHRDRPRFPFVRRRGVVALVGLSTAVPTGPFMAWGRLGPEQVAALAPLLSRLGGEGRFRVVLLHHPPLASARDRFKRLVDRDAFAAVIARCGAELILHGHNHVGSVGWMAGPGQPVPVVGVPSASALGRRYESAGFHIYAIDAAAGGGWRCELAAWRWDEAGSRLVVRERRELSAPAR